MINKTNNAYKTIGEVAELLNIKSMVESSEELPSEIKTKITTT